MNDQILIKSILLAFIVGVGLMIAWPGTGARRLALRRIGLLAAVLTAAIFVIFPALSNDIAQVVGVGRGADLLLYGLTLAFIGYVISEKVFRSRADIQMTELARAIALSQQPTPDERRKSLL